jgi:tight adherence protein B
MNGARIVSAPALAAALALGAVSAPAALAQEALTVVAGDVSGYPDLRLVVAAPPTLGDQALPAEAFTVMEGGAPRPHTVEALPAESLDVALVIDTSGSMTGAPLAAAKAAAQAFLAQLPATVPVSVVGFGATAAVVSPPSTDRAALSGAIANLRAAGETALYDALQVGVGQLPAAQTGRGSRVMVLLSDGGDTASKTSLDAVADTIAGAKVSVFAVELRTPESNSAALARLASAAGGAVVPAADPAALGASFDTIGKQLLRRYAVTYASLASGPTDVEIAVESRGTRASVVQRIELPGLAAVRPSGTSTGARESGGGSATWVFVLGAALVGTGLLLALAGVLVFRAPRAKGLNLARRSTRLTGAAQRAEAIGETLITRHDPGARVSGALDAAGLDLRPGELVLAVAGADLLALLLAWALAGPVAALAVAVLVPVAAKVVIGVLAQRRRDAFADQLPETLQMLAGSLRAGHALAQAVDTVAREAESPTSDEFRRLTIETRLGRDFREALAAVASRVRSTDFDWVVQAIEIQREVGGDLAEILDAVGTTIRDRNRVRRQVQALSAEGRLSAWVLMVLPFAMASVMFVTNRTYLSTLWSSSLGVALVLGGAVLLAIGALWLRRIVKPVF